MIFERFQIRHLYPILPVALAAVVAAAPIRDNSFLWHVRAGSVQVASSRVLATDPFSYMTEGEAWRTQSWLVELLYAIAESTLGGVGWAPALAGVTIVATLAVIALVTYANVRSTFSTGVWLLIMVWLLVPFIQPRPVVFSYLLLAMIIMSLSLGERVQWIIVPIVWMWAGIHGSWVIGIGLVMLVAVSRRSPRLAILGTVAAMATAMTAHGIGAWSILYSFARNSSALEYMAEWSTPDFADIVHAPYLIVLTGLLVGAVKGRIAMSDLWVVIPFVILGFMSQRMVPVAALVLLPFAARSFRVTLAASERRLDVIPWIVLSAVFVVAVAAHLMPRDEFNKESFPSDAAVDAAGTGRFFHDDVVGGYLIYRDGPERSVYIDDRAELYGAARLGEFVDARDGSYRILFDSTEMTAALVRPDWRLRTELLEDGWRVTYEDAFFEVLEPNGQNEELESSE